VEKKNEQQAEIQQRAGGVLKIVALAALAGEPEDVVLLMDEAHE